jgi:hypothetical protein
MKLLPSLGLGIIFAAGCDAYSLGMPRSAAPGETGTDGHLSWLAGWDEAHQALDQIQAPAARPATEHDLLP